MHTFSAENLAESIADAELTRDAELAARAMLCKARVDRLSLICANPDDESLDYLIDLEERLNARGGYRDVD